MLAHRLGVPHPTLLVLGRLGGPRSVVTVLEGEGLVNDARALVAHRMAMGAVVAGSFSGPAAGLRFAIAAAGGIASGFAAALLVIGLRKAVGRAPLVENT